MAKDTGQGNAMLRVLADASTPDGMEKVVKKIVQQANDDAGWLTKLTRGKKPIVVTDAEMKLIKDKMRSVVKLPDGPEKAQAMQDVLNTVNSKIPVGASEIFDAYRYQNLLSNPRTSGRNILTGLTQTYIARPATIAVAATQDAFAANLFGKQRSRYLSEVPEYYRGLMGSYSDAADAAKEAWKGGNIDIPDLKTLRAFQQEGMKKGWKKGLTVIPRGMEAQDKFLMKLVSSGEYAAGKARGLTDKEALKQADEIAKYSLFRAALDPTNKTGQGKLLSSIDRATNTITNIGNKHKVFRWFVPFVRTPMNISKQMIEYSPAGLATLPGSTKKTEQLAKTLIGSTIFAVGAQMALENNTTWDVPKSKAERELFYAQGKRPYSVKIGDNWVPMIYLGPWSAALAIPAAARDAHQEAPLDASQMEKLAGSVTNMADFFTGQTYLEGAKNFMNVITGQEDANLASSLGFTAGQALPLQGLQRFVSGVIDPIYRKKEGFADSIKADIPFLSKNLEPYTDAFTGEPSKRI